MKKLLKAKNRARKSKSNQIFPNPKHWIQLVPRPLPSRAWPPDPSLRSPFYSPFPYEFPKGSVWSAEDFRPEQLEGPCVSPYCSTPAPYYTGINGKKPVCCVHLYENIFKRLPPSNCSCSLSISFHRPLRKCKTCFRNVKVPEDPATGLPPPSPSSVYFDSSSGTYSGSSSGQETVPDSSSSEPNDKSQPFHLQVQYQNHCDQESDQNHYDGRIPETVPAECPSTEPDEAEEPRKRRSWQEYQDSDEGYYPEYRTGYVDVEVRM
jgi:hypothetical protein